MCSEGSPNHNESMNRSIADQRRLSGEETNFVFSQDDTSTVSDKSEVDLQIDEYIRMVGIGGSIKDT